jgi:hypothetical protein
MLLLDPVSRPKDHVCLALGQNYDVAEILQGNYDPRYDPSSVFPTPNPPLLDGLNNRSRPSYPFATAHID